MLSFLKTIFYLIFTALTSALLCAQAFGISDIDSYTEEAKRVKQKISHTESQIQSYSEAEKKYLAELNKLDRNLDEIQRKLSSAELALAELEQQILTAQQEAEILGTTIIESEEYAAQRLAALYKLTRIGEMQIIGSADSINDYFRRKMAVREIFAHDQRLINDLIERKQRLSALLIKLHQDKARQGKLRSEYNHQHTRLNQTIKQRTDLLNKTLKEKSLAMVAVKGLQTAASELDEKINQLRLQAKQEAKSKHTEPSDHFSQYMGLLKIPVKGTIITEFGEYKDTEFNIAGFRNGISIKAEKGEPFRSVRAGKVIFSNWLKGYGNLIIVDHGNHYYTLYAHAKELYKKEGDQIKTDEIIGAVGDTGSLEGVKLHFEVRHHGKPIDPIKWLKQQ